jgi:hypothetical protein
MSDQERPPQDSFAEVSSSTVGLPFTAERLAFLQPRLRLLLADFQSLDALVPASTEPAFTPLTYNEGGTDAD